MADAKKSQDMFRNMFHKRPLDDGGLPPPKTDALNLPPPKTAAEKAAGAAAEALAAAPAPDELDEEAIEDALFGDMMPEAKEISAEEARRNAQMVTSNKSLVKDQQPLPPGWVQRVSNKKSKGRVYYVNLRTKKFQRERPVADHVSAQVEEAAQPAAKKQKTKPKVANVSDGAICFSYFSR